MLALLCGLGVIFNKGNNNSSQNNVEVLKSNLKEYDVNSLSNTISNTINNTKSINNNTIGNNNTKTNTSINNSNPLTLPIIQ